MNKKKIINGVLKKLKEMSSVGFSTGIGPQYATPFAFKKNKLNNKLLK